MAIYALISLMVWCRFLPTIHLPVNLIQVYSHSGTQCFVFVLWVPVWVKQILCDSPAGLADGHPADPHSLSLAASAGYGHPQLQPPVRSDRVTSGGAFVWELYTTNIKLEVTNFSQSSFIILDVSSQWCWLVVVFFPVGHLRAVSTAAFSSKTRTCWVVSIRPSVEERLRSHDHRIRGAGCAVAVAAGTDCLLGL